jgi:rare lipoprotein A
MRTFLAILFTINLFTAFAETQEVGVASVYSATFQGKRTASGEYFNHSELTAAHQKYPFGTLVKVTRLDNGKSVVVRINDRGPYVNQRITDLSKSAALRLGVNNENEQVRVKLEPVNYRNVEVTQSKERNNFSNASNGSNDRPRSTPSSEKAEINSKSVQERAVIKEYKYVPSIGNRYNQSQKKNLKL